MSPPSTLVWFRNDLRLADNPALWEAVERGAPVVPVFIMQEAGEKYGSPGGAGRWWLHYSLHSLDADLRRAGSRLIVRTGDPLSVLRQVAEECHAEAVFWNRRYEPAAVACDAEVKAEFRARGLTIESFNGSLLYEPWQVLNQEEKPYRVFTPFWKACLALREPGSPLPEPAHIPAPEIWPVSLPIEQLHLEPKIGWAQGLRAAWTPGSEGAGGNLGVFLDEALEGYETERDRPDRQGTSRLSPYLRFGEISPRQVWRAVREFSKNEARTRLAGSAQAFLRQLGWREFAYYLLFHFPYTPDQPLDGNFAAFPWREDREALTAWQKGRTGYPYIDAGMRELWHTGWMHNRARMGVASFLVKDMLIPWQAGAAWFWDTLVDADLANNTLGWQWTAGCGADAAPYFRVFNPVSQGEKFDPEGRYVRAWVPELANLPGRWIHKPWEAPERELKKAGVELGKDYPYPMVDHAAARLRALELYQNLKKPS